MRTFGDVQRQQQVERKLQEVEGMFSFLGSVENHQQLMAAVELGRELRAMRRIHALVSEAEV